MRVILQLVVLCVLGVMLTLVPAQAQNQEKIDLLDQKLIPLLDGLDASRPPSQSDLQALQSLVEEMNAAGQSHMTDQTVVQVEPRFFKQWLDDQKITKAALALCAESLYPLRTCAEAGQYLMEMTTQCGDSVFLGVVNLDVYPDVPPNFMQGAYEELGDQNFILLLQNPELNNQLSEVRINAVLTPDTVALVMCPERSRAFGHVLRLLQPFD